MRTLQKIVVVVLFAIIPLFSGIPASAVVEYSTLVQISSPLNNATSVDSQVITGIGPADEYVIVIIDRSIASIVDVDSTGVWSFEAIGLSVGSHTVQAVWPKNFYAFVSNLNDRNISVISTLTDEFLTNFTIDLSAMLQDVVLTPDHSKAYVLDSNLENSGGVWAVDVKNYSVEDEPIDDKGIFPFAGASSIDGSMIYVVNFGSSNLSVINTETDFVSGPYDLSGNSEINGLVDIAVEPVDGEVAYVANYDANKILIINLDDLENNPIAGSIETACSPNAIVFSPDGTRAYVAESCLEPETGAIVEVINVETGTVIDTIEMSGVAEKYPQSIDITPDGSKLLVVDLIGDSISIIETSDNSVTRNLAVGTNPTAVAINFNGTKAYVTNSGSDDVSVIDLVNEMVNENTIEVGDFPNGLGLLEDLYFSDEVNFSIATATVPVVVPEIIKPADTTYYWTSDETVVPDVVQTVAPSTPVVKEVTNSNQTAIDNSLPLADSDSKASDWSFWIWFSLSLLILLIIYIFYRIYRKKLKDGNVE